MRLFGFLLLIVGFLLCVSIVIWAAVGFLMMGFGLICLLVAERSRKRSAKSDVSDLAVGPHIGAAPGLDKAVSRQQPAIFVEPTFAAASPGTDIGIQVGANNSPVLEEDWSQPAKSAVAPSWVETVGDRSTPPPLRTARSFEFDRIRPLRTERGTVRSEPEFRDFSAPLEREPRQAPPLPPLPAHSVSAAAGVPPPVVVLQPIVAESKAATQQARPGTVSVKPATVRTERSDADDLTDLFNKFDLRKY
jgi:hypothetical protein